MSTKLNTLARDERDRLRAEGVRTVDTVCDGCSRTLRVNLPALTKVETDLARAREALDRVGKVIADAGCDCDGDSDHDRPCEEYGHEPCLVHRVQRALSAPPSASPQPEATKPAPARSGEGKCCEHAGKPNVMDAVGGPQCHCGRWSVHPSGACADCSKPSPSPSEDKAEGALGQIIADARTLQGWERSIVRDGSYEAAAPGEESEETMGCPLCSGEGEVDAQRYDSKATLPATLVGYGVGEGLAVAERWAEGSVAAVLTLAGRLDSLRAENQKMREALERFVDAHNIAAKCVCGWCHGFKEALSAREGE